MFAPELYKPIFLSIAYILVLLKIIPPERILLKASGNSNLVKACLVGSFFIIFFGFRPTYSDPYLYMADTIGYASFYNSLKGNANAIDVLLLNDDGSFNFNSEFIFGGIRNIMAVVNLPVEAWLLVVAAIFIIPKILVSKILFPGREYLVFLFFITSMGFYSGGTNGIRNADGSSVFILGLSLICSPKPRKLLGALLCLSSYYFHHSEVILIVSLIISLCIVKKTNFAIIIWFAAILISLIGGNSLAFLIGPYFEDDRVNSYILGDSIEGYRTGFRWDFLVYSAAPILIGWYTTVRLGIKDKLYQIILNTYIIANAIWIIFMYASYTNRFAALSWSLFPIIICYPLLNHNIFGKSTPQKTALFLFCQLIFITLI